MTLITIFRLTTSMIFPQLKFTSYFTAFLALALTSITDAATFTVTNTNDSGANSLRDAIDQSNSPLNPGKDTILFNIPGNGPHVIAPIMGPIALPTITDPVHIDGYSQPGAQRATSTVPATIKIVISGENMADFLVYSGIRIETDDSEIHGLSIINFPGGHGIFIQNGSHNEIMGNYVGLSPSGVVTRDPHTGAILTGNGFGIAIQTSGSQNRIGSSTEWTRNVISGNLNSDIILRNQISGTTTASSMANNQIQNNYIGADPLGNTIINESSSVAPLQSAITLSSALLTQVGGNATTEGNLIAGRSIGITVNPSSFGMLSGLVTIEGNDFVNNETAIDLYGLQNTVGGSTPNLANMISNPSSQSTGIRIYEFGDNEIIGNFIGYERGGRRSNLMPGVGISIESSSGNSVGGPNVGNLIAAQIVGVQILEQTSISVENRISQNPITSTLYGSAGIDLASDGITFNDPGDADTGANTLLNYPELLRAQVNAARNGIDLLYDLDAQPGDTVTIEFYASRTCARHGERFVGETTFIIPKSGFGMTKIDRISSSAQSSNPSSIRYASPKGRYTVSTTVLGSINRGENITATKTVNNNTSEFSDCVIVM